MSTAYCFDLSGTLIRQNPLTMIASLVDLTDEVSVLAEAAFNGYLPFENSFRLIVRLLRDADLSSVRHVLETGVEFDLDVLSFIKSQPDNSFVISSNLDLWVKPLLDRIGVNWIASQSQLRCDGSLEGVAYILNKGDAVQELRGRFERVVAVGCGVNDVPMFESADVRIAYAGVCYPNKFLVELSDFVVGDGKALCRILNML